MGVDRRMAQERILTVERPLSCRVVGRVNRFVVTVRPQGRCSRAYINNTGRMYQFLVSGREGFCTAHEKPRKTDVQLFSVEEGNLGAIVDTRLQMRAFEEALRMELIPWLRGCRLLKRDARLGDSRIDYLLQCDGEEVYLEVKSAVLREGHHAMYPDCPSCRGKRHIRELTHHVRQGGRATILFIAALPNVEAFKPNRAADPGLYQSLVAAHDAGVRIKSIGMLYRPEDCSICLYDSDLAVHLR